jgi:hypothetical protein
MALRIYVRILKVNTPFYCLRKITLDRRLIYGYNTAMKKSITVRFLVTPEQREELDRLAKAMDLSISDIIRLGVLAMAKKVKHE